MFTTEMYLIVTEGFRVCVMAFISKYYPDFASDSDSINPILFFFCYTGWDAHVMAV